MHKDKCIIKMRVIAIAAHARMSLLSDLTFVFRMKILLHFQIEFRFAREMGRDGEGVRAGMKNGCLKGNHFSRDRKLNVFCLSGDKIFCL